MKYLQSIKHILYFMLFTLFINTSCTEAIEHWGEEAGDINVNGSFADFKVNGTSSVIEGENKIEDVKACVFTNGLLSKVYDNIALSSEGRFSLTMKETKGNLYVVANASAVQTWHGMEEGVLTEEDWKERLVTMTSGADAKHYFTGFYNLADYVPGNSLSLVLKRGVARFDLVLKQTKSTIKSIKLSHIASQAYFLPQPTVQTPESTEFIELAKNIAQTESQDRYAGLFYLYEQVNNGLKITVEAIKDGQPKTVEKMLTFAEIKRNNVYTVELSDKANGDLNIALEVEDWEDGEDTDLRPDLDSEIVLNEGESSLQGASVSHDKRTLIVPHYAAEMVVAVDCDNELEAVYEGAALVQIEPYIKDGVSVRNKFLVKKKQVAPGTHYNNGKIRFKRKGYQHIYAEDLCEIHFMDNTAIKIEGSLSFDENSVCSFNDYIDGDLGVFEVEEGKEVVASFAEGEDTWALVKNDIEGYKNKYRIVGGWKPNDPTANGREQAMTLTVRDKNATKSSKVEVYTIKRRNYGLPVVELNGIWWCKYNAIGNSKDFKDQILCGNDPARIANQTVQEYLKQCSSTDFIKLWNATYMGASGKALKAVYRNDKFTLDGWYDEKTHICTIDPKFIAPTGYELPTFEDYKHIFRPYNNIPEDSWSGEYRPEIPGNNNDFNVRITRTYRKDLTLDEQTLPSQMVIAIESTKGKGTEPLMFYGVGCQWNSGGGVNHDWLIIASKWTTSNSPWAWAWKDSGKTFTTNGAGANNTRTIRFRKSPVEYIYE